MLRRTTPVLALLAALAFAEPAAPFTSTHLTLAAGDGTNLQATLYRPDGRPPPGGWPAILMLHRLGGSRLDTNTLAESSFVPAGYVVLTYDARGHRESGGLVTLAGPREVEDVRDLHRWLVRRADVDATRVGAWGISYGGAQALLAAGFGVSFAAIVTVEGWSDLYSALFPNDVPKSGVVGGILSDVPQGRLDPALDYLRTDGIVGGNLDVLRSFAAARSPLGVLGTLATPTLVVHGRRDFAFGLDQATAAFAALRGPKRLFVAPGASAPATSPAPDGGYGTTLARRWFDRFLRGETNGVDSELPVELASDPWRAPPTAFVALPRTRTLRFALTGSRTIGPRDRAVLDAATPRATLETFGAPIVSVRASARSGWSRLVALVSAVTPDQREILVGVGAVPTVTGTRTYTIPLNSSVTKIPARSRLRVTFGSTTTATPGGLMYLDLGMPPRARVTLGRVRLSLPALVRRVSS